MQRVQPRGVTLPVIAAKTAAEAARGDGQRGAGRSARPRRPERGARGVWRVREAGVVATASRRMSRRAGGRADGQGAGRRPSGG